MNMNLKAISIVAILGLCVLSSCERKPSANSDTQDIASSGAKFEPRTDMLAVIYTNKGVIKVGLDYVRVPMTVANFVALAEGKKENIHRKLGVPFYDDIAFHRVIPNFMIQTGDPTGKGAGNTGSMFPDEIIEDLRHDDAGILSMANSGPNSNSCQFFITHTATPHLDGIHTVFGKVIEGMDIVNSIAQDDRIDSLRIQRLSPEAQQFDAVKVFESQKQILVEKNKNAITDQYSAKQSSAVYKAFEEYVKQVYPNATKTPSGLYFVKHNNTDGIMPQPGNIVKVHYKGTFTNNKVFDESYSRAKPIEFPLGRQEVIAGWDEGLALLHKGEKATLIVPYYLAYGDEGRPPVIGQKEHLIFEVELLDVK